MTGDRERQETQTGQARWTPSPRHVVAGGLIALAAGVFLLGAAYVGPLGSGDGSADAGPVMTIAHVEPKPVDYSPGEKMDVLADYEDGFTGVPAREPEPEFADFVTDAVAAFESEFLAPPRVVRVERRPVEAAVRLSTPDRPQDCTYARSRAEAMICRDARLGAADRDMRAALDRAIEAGVDARRVMADQSAWESARERAAVDGVGAVDRLYRIRMDELQSIN